jgi:hypothetical protein
MDDVRFVDSESPEWYYMWEQLARHPINRDQADPTLCENNGESWEYMGTELLPNRQWIHKFRHRMHPVMEDEYTYVDVPTSIDQASQSRQQ